MQFALVSFQKSEENIRAPPSSRADLKRHLDGRLYSLLFVISEIHTLT